MSARTPSFVSRLAAAVCLAALAFAPAGQLRAQDPPAVHPERLLVKLAEGSGAELKGGRLTSRTGTDLGAVAELFTHAAAEPLVTALPWDELDRLHANACAKLPPHNRPGHLGLWFRLRCTSPAAAAELAAALRIEPLVAHVYAEPIYYMASARPVPAPAPVPLAMGDIPPPTPLFTAMQHAHEPTPVGHGVRLVDGVLGARGQGTKVIMIETSWILGHEDVGQMVAASFIGPVPPVDLAYAQHGLSGGSIVCADRNGYGITGLSDGVTARFVSLELNGGYENAIALTLANSQPGDVILVVLMVLVPSLGPGTWLPFEFLQSAFDATLTATANDRMVLEPAGNGNRSLDDPALLGRFDRSFRDSGAVIVGASDGGLLQRAPFCNWGTRIDANGWGDNVVACGYGTLFFPNNDLLQAYTASATGTSSATPQIAGVVAAMQGAARRQLGHPLTNQQVLDLLHAHGPTTPDVIGRRPDLVAILEAIGAIDGLRLDVPDVMLGGSATVTMTGPPLSIAALFGSFGTTDLPLGFNRNLHLDLASLASLGAFVLPTGSAQFTLGIPNTASLQGVDVYFQAVRLTGSAPLFVTNSGQLTIL